MMLPPLPKSWQPLRGVLLDRNEHKLWHKIRVRLRSGTLRWNDAKIREVAIAVEAGRVDEVLAEVRAVPERSKHEPTCEVTWDEIDEILAPPPIDADLTGLIEKWGAASSDLG